MRSGKPEGVPGTESNNDYTEYIIEDGLEEFNKLKEESISYLPNEKIVVTQIPAETSNQCYIYVKRDYSGVQTQYLEELNYMDSILKVVAEQVIVVESN